MTALSAPLITMDKTRAHKDTRGPYSMIKLTKHSVDTFLDKLPPPSFYKILYLFIYINICTYTSLSIFMYLCAKSIPIANKLVSLANGYKQMLTVLN